MKKHDCALFDLDGVIVDTAKFHFLSWKKIASIFNYDLTSNDNEQLKGVSRSDCLQIILKMANTVIEPSKFEKYLAQKNLDYLDFIQDLGPKDILPGIFETLIFLNKRKVKIGLGSASKNAEVILSKLGLTSFFEIVIDGNKVNKSKPHPEVFLRGSLALGVAPEKCLVFEDSASGIISAKAAGMTAVAIGNPDKFLNEDFCYPNFLSLVKNDLDKLF
jgi:beta-phosphoglucomutase